MPYKKLSLVWSAAPHLREEIYFNLAISLLQKLVVGKLKKIKIFI